MPVEMYPQSGPKRSIRIRYVDVKTHTGIERAVLCSVQASVRFRPF